MHQKSGGCVAAVLVWRRRAARSDQQGRHTRTTETSHCTTNDVLLERDLLVVVLHVHRTTEPHSGAVNRGKRRPVPSKAWLTQSRAGMM